MHADANDYLSLIAGLGNECLGAIKIIENLGNKITPKYQLLSQSEVRELAREGAAESAQLVTKAHLSLTGASGKVGLYFDDKEQKWYLPLGEAPSTHIVKQSHVRFLKTIRLAPAYDIISTMAYEKCTENMALSIDGIYDINQITRESFEKEAEYIGLGKKVAMIRFDTMVNKFVKAMKLAQNELKEQGFHQVDEICNKILEKGGIKRFL